MTNEQPNTRAGEAFDPPCTDCGDTGVTFQTERACTCDAATRPLTQPSELVDDLHNEADLCRNEGADDIAKLLDQAAAQIAKLQAERDHYAGLYAERCGDVAKLQADGDKLAGALEAFQRHYDLNDCDERCGALEVPISDLRRACQALTGWKDRA